VDADRTDTAEEEADNQPKKDNTEDEEGGFDIGSLFGSDSDDDDDDEDSLYPAAIAGVIAIGALAIVGGTIGYYGSPEMAPIGLMSGYVEADMGILFQIAINKQVFGKAEGSENLMVGLTGFYNAFNSPFQPAIGAGALFTEEGSDGVTWQPSVMVGIVGNFGRIVLLTGYDVITPDFRFGIGVNLRHKK